LAELKSRTSAGQRGEGKADKERKKALKELRLLRERLEALIIEKDEQERLAWKFQEEVDSLTEQLDLEHKARINAEKVVKQIKSELDDVKEASEDAVRGRARADQLARDLAPRLRT
jgi:chromosome segregation ATPase